MVATEQHIARIRELRADEEAAWDAFVSQAPNGHILQSWAWGEFKRAYGWQPVRLALFLDGEIVAAAQALIRSIAGVSLPYVPRGPVVAPDRPDLYVPLLDAIHRLSRSRHGVFLKVEPNELAGSLVESMLRSRGFLHSAHTVQARATLHIPLDGGEEAVLAGMKGKARYNIRLAERRGVQVRAASSADDLARFHQLMVETGGRDAFPVRSLAYYRDVLEAFRSRGQGELLLAEFDGVIVAGIMVFAYGPEGIYMYGASANEHRREMPTYLLQWRAIQWCLEHGCSRYDMWGIPE
ncbi:MAG: aminoacyltransferase, partial [Chloroflexota bacterium]|nr:aminoacyltransferase [Chloroflexota bacterium]